MAKYWFFDTALSKKTENATRIPGKLKKYNCNPLFGEGLYSTPSLPWEPRFDNGYPNVIFDPTIHKYRCYYTGFVVDSFTSSTPLKDRLSISYKPSRDRVAGILYAESKNGIDWEKPFLGITDFQGSTENNILDIYAQGASVLYEPEASDPGKRYKMIARDDHHPFSLYTAFSSDGIHFGEKNHIVLGSGLLGDTHNFVVKDHGKNRYLLFTRKFSRGIRTVVRLVSDDFLHWSDCREVFRGVDADDQIYSMPVFFHEGLYWGLAAVFHDGDERLPKHDHVEVELCYSGDGIGWQRVAPYHPFIPNGEGEYGTGVYDSGCCFSSVPISFGESYHFYYMGGNGTHYGFRETGLCLATISKNRLAGVTGKNRDMFLYRTCYLSMGKKEASICTDVLEGGSIQYELLDQTGEVIPGYSKELCIPITSSSDQAKLLWRDQTVYPEVCAIQFYCKQAILYSIAGKIELCLSHPI